jgi:hypothetical protein
MTGRPTCWCSPPTWGFWLGMDICGRCESLLVSPKKTPPSLFPATQQKLWHEVIPLTPTFLVFLCMVDAYGDLLCALAKRKELVRDSIRKKNMWNGRQLWTYVHIWRHKRSTCPEFARVFSSWYNRLYMLLIFSLCFYSRMPFLN